MIEKKIQQEWIELYERAVGVDEIKRLRAQMAMIDMTIKNERKVASYVILEAALVFLKVQNCPAKDMPVRLVRVIDSMYKDGAGVSLWFFNFTSEISGLSEKDFQENPFVARLVMLNDILSRFPVAVINSNVSYIISELSNVLGIPKKEFAPETSDDWIEVRGEKECPDKKKTCTGGPAEFQTPIEIYKALSETVVGQEEAKKMMSVALFRHMAKIKGGSGIPSTGNNIMMIGPTGSGKSLLAKTAARLSGLPWVCIEASQLTEDGWSGLSRDTVLSSLLDQSEKYGEYGIVILDEFDKLVSMGHSSQGDNIGRQRQSLFLTMLDGVPIIDSRSGRSLSTKNLMFILTGAFTSIEENRERKKKAKTSGIGFTLPTVTPEEPMSASEELRHELIEAGCIPEIVGRISTIIENTLLSEEEMVKAVMTMPESVVAQACGFFKASGKELVVDVGYIQEIVHKIRNMGLGVRGCNNYIDDMVKRLLYEAYEADIRKVYLGPVAEKGEKNGKEYVRSSC